MISIIICGRAPQPAEDLIQNIKYSIGCIYELIYIDNSQGTLSLLQAYLQGVKRSSFPNLCLLHDDVRFDSLGWGLTLANHLHNKDTGIVGVAGSHLHVDTPSGWWTSGRFSEYILHTSPRTGKDKHLDCFNLYNEQFSSQAICLDGVFLGIRRDTWNRLQIPPPCDITRFHGYDSEICLQAHQLGLKNRVAFNILVHHFSEGSFGKDWLRSAMILHIRWAHVLPLATSSSEWQYLEEARRRGWSEFLSLSLRLGFFTDAIRHFLRYISFWRFIKLTLHPQFLHLFFWHLLRRPL